MKAEEKNYSLEREFVEDYFVGLLQQQNYPQEIKLTALQPAVDYHRIPGEINGEYLKDAVNLANRVLRIANYSLELRLYKESGIFCVKAVSRDDVDMMHAIPNEMVIRFANQIKAKLEESVSMW